MRAYITATHEPTLELAKWSLARWGFDVVVVQGDDRLSDKLSLIYHEAKDDFVRMDADVIANSNVQMLGLQGSSDTWWEQYLTFDMYKCDVTHGGIQLIKKEALKYLRANIGDFMHDERPETRMYRLDELNPHCATREVILGVHGWGGQDIKQVKLTKSERLQLDGYDWELVERMQEFYR